MKYYMSHNDYVNDQVNRKGFFIKKKYSQNFLLDENIIHKIINAGEIDENTYVIEIGPGFGALTKHLVKVAKKVLLYEIDGELIPHLRKLFENQTNIHIFHKDFLKIENIDDDINQFLDGKKVVVMSNLPYHVTTPILMKILEESKKVKRLILMMQFEVARRLTSSPNSKDYNALSVIIQDQTDANYLFKVPKTVFKPRPSVDSAVIRLDVYENHLANPSFYQFVHQCFRQRRKTLLNNLYQGYALNKNAIKSLLDALNLHDKIRAEALNLEDFKNIYYRLVKEEVL
ncbi:MAG TPA: 16S rRNA (adenine(1518)-N(6)/adenine(1519)-N(6))-dimethyltransferase RsmA [Candidatus Izemoplasmatales bacterium]|nr:16S rRNA (adenine(1518)-N(6)/adenine(1519)-N(6))-dimethyltransferase RsmA [Candidatus Izemoplasmatales bacterium]